MKSSSSSISSRAFGCISSFLRRFLCSHTSPASPSHQISEFNSNLHQFDSEHHGYKGDEPGVLNSVDCLKRDSEQIQGKFPDFVELADENFIILSFEKEKLEGTRESDKSFGEPKRKRSRKCRNRRKRRDFKVQRSKTEKSLMRTDMEGKDNHEKAINASFWCENLETREQKHFGESEEPLKDLKHQRTNECKNRRKRTENEARQVRTAKLEDKESKKGALDTALRCDRLQDSVESYCRSKDEILVPRKAKGPEEEEDCEDSSPVSVLDYDRFEGVRETQESENTLRRQLSPEHEPKELDLEAIQEDRRTVKNRWGEYDKQSHHYDEMCLEICRIAETEIRGTYWDLGKALKQESLVGISVDVASLVLDQLLEETIQHLASPKITCKS